jgi:hypothetical protein
MGENKVSIRVSSFFLVGLLFFSGVFTSIIMPFGSSVDENEFEVGNSEAPLNTSKPYSIITTPKNNSKHYQLNWISGDASVSANNTTIIKVEICIKRLSDNKYWTGSSWNVTKIWLLASGNWSWNYNTNSVTWTSGTDYLVQSRATDGFFRVEIPKWGNKFTMNFNEPYSSITKPLNNAYLTKLDTISGTAGSHISNAISKVEVRIKRLVDDHYWNGTGWTNSTQPWLLASGTNSWNYNTSMITWDTGYYFVQSRATDNQSNIENTSSGIYFNIDNSNPTSTINTPQNNSAIMRLTRIAVTASDTNVTGNGSWIKAVDIVLKRLSDNYYWDGSNWVINITWLSMVEGSNYTAWYYYTTNIFWKNGTQYLVRSRAIDYVNNMEVPSYGNIFTITQDTFFTVVTSINNNSYYNRINSVNGVTNYDNSELSINKVEILIKRDIDNYYWNGINWNITKTWLLALGNATWMYNSTSVQWSNGGKYRVQSRAFNNKSDIETPSYGKNFRMDLIAPNSSIIYPTNNSIYNEMSILYGYANDLGLSGVKTVEISIKRMSDNKYWDGSKWNNSLIWKYGGLYYNFTYDWYYYTMSISWTNNTKYHIRSRAIDFANNIESPGYGIIFTFQSGTLPPTKLTSTITSPANNSYVKVLNSISGTASTPSNNTTISKVEILIFRDNLTWNGANWSSSTTWLLATGTTSWSYNSGSVNWNSSGWYLIRSRATDNKSRVETPSYGNMFKFDNQKPYSSISTPKHNSFSGAISSISGWASDPGNSGISFVDITIQRMDNNLYWSGTSWVNSTVWLRASGSYSWWYNTGNTSMWTYNTTYRIRSRATDRANNVETPSSGNLWTYRIMPQRPKTYVDTPKNNTNLNSLTQTKGRAYSDLNYSTINKVEIFIKNLNNNKYWSGSGWVSSSTWLLASGTISWSYNTASVTWSSGNDYLIRPRATDNRSQTSNFTYGHVFKFDNTRPKSNIITPVNNSNVSSIPQITGNSSDAGGSGIFYVAISLKRLTDGKYWDGYYWNNSVNWIWAMGKTTWAYSLNSSWSTGQYHVRSKAVDWANNVENPSFGNIFYYGTSSPNTTKPSSTIGAPLNGAYLKSVNSISGTATDKSGSGLKRVDICIKRLNDNKYWQGNLWKSSEFWFMATGSGSWSYDPQFITWKTDMSYNIRSRAIDNYYNIENPGVGVTFMFDNNPPSNLNITINNGTKYTKSTSVSLKLDAVDSGSGLSQMAFMSESQTTWSSWEVFSSDKSYKLPIGDGEKTVYFKIKDKANNTAIANDTIILDTTSPKFISFTANNAKIYTNTREIDLEIEVDEVYSKVVFGAYSDDGSLWSKWVPFDLSTTRAEGGFITTKFTLPPGDGPKIIHYRLQDEAGNTEDHYYDNIILDTTPPEELSILINEDDMYTNSDEVTLTINANDSLSGLNEMSLSTDGTIWSTWEPFTNEKSFTLSPLDGEKTVYVVVKDNAENIKQAFDKIILDTVSPYSLSIIINNGAFETNSREVMLQLNAIDDTSGVGFMAFSTDGFSWTSWETINSGRLFTLTPNDGEKTIYFNVMDKAGNIADPVEATITLITSETKIDSDSDGFPDESDAFPNDPAASIDSDGDNSPDQWNPGKSDADSTTGLFLDAFPNDPAASKDSDGDDYPDSWNPGKSELDSTTGLTLDAHPKDPNRHLVSKSTENPILLLLPIVIIIIIVIVGILILSLVLRKRHGKVDDKFDEDKILNDIRSEILHGKLQDGSILTDEEIKQKVDEKYQRGEISGNAYFHLKK